MPKISGKNRFREKLKKMSGPQLEKNLAKVLLKVGQRIQVDAQISLTTGAVSGKNHKPSAPGSPPNNDTGVLADSIQTVLVEPLLVEVYADAPYARIQEYGGTIDHPGGTPYFMRAGKPVFVSNSGYGAHHTLPKTKPHEITLPERPFMRPALKKSIPRLERLFGEAVTSTVKSGGGSGD